MDDDRGPRPAKFRRVDVPARFRLRTAVAVGLACLVGSMAAAPAGAAIPPAGTKLIWRNSVTNFCLGVAAGNVDNGNAIIVWRCNNNTDQTWTAESINPGAPGPYLLRNGTNRNKCLTVSGRRQDHGAPLVIWDCLAVGVNAGQLWVLQDGRKRADCTIFVNVNSNLVMGVSAASTVEGTPVIQWEDIGHPDQEWCGRNAPVN
jgi:hypothetical protein